MILAQTEDQFLAARKRLQVGVSEFIQDMRAHELNRSRYVGRLQQVIDNFYQSIVEIPVRIAQALVRLLK